MGLRTRSAADEAPWRAPAAPASYRVLSPYDYDLERRPMRRSVAPSKGIGLKGVFFLVLIGGAVASSSLAALRYLGPEAYAATPAAARPAPVTTAAATTSTHSPPTANAPAAASTTAGPSAAQPPAVLELDEPRAIPETKTVAAKPPRAVRRAPRAPTRGAAPLPQSRGAIPSAKDDPPPTTNAVVAPAESAVAPPPNPYGGDSAGDATTGRI